MGSLFLCEAIYDYEQQMFIYATAAVFIIKKRNRNAAN
jgi:hypothetical protein